MLRVFAIRVASSMWATVAPLVNDLDGLAVGDDRGAAYDDPLAAPEPLAHGDEVAAHLAEPDAAKARGGGGGVRDHVHGVAGRVPRRPHDGGERHQQRGGRGLVP